MARTLCVACTCRRCSDVENGADEKTKEHKARQAGRRLKSEDQQQNNNKRPSGRRLKREDQNAKKQKRQSGRHLAGQRMVARLASLAVQELAAEQEAAAQEAAEQVEAAKVELAAAAASRSEMGTQTPVTYVTRSGPIYVRAYHPLHAPPPIDDVMLEVDYYIDVACASILFGSGHKLTCA